MSEVIKQLLIVIVVLGGIGFLFGLGLAFSADVFKVEVDERMANIEKMLPGYNCGACGYPGCAGFAEGIVEGEVANLSNCKPGKDEHYNPILAYLQDHPNEDGSLIKISK